MSKLTAKGLLFGTRRAGSRPVVPMRKGRVHHVSYVIAEADYWGAVAHLVDHDLDSSSQLPHVADDRAWDIMQDLLRWGWVERGEAWSLSDAGQRAFEMHS